MAAISGPGQVGVVFSRCRFKRSWFVREEIPQGNLWAEV